MLEYGLGDWSESNQKNCVKNHVLKTILQKLGLINYFSK